MRVYVKYVKIHKRDSMNFTDSAQTVFSGDLRFESSVNS